MLVSQIDSVVQWLTANVCSKITLKVPDDHQNDADYSVKMVHPAAFPLYVPGKERLPPNVSAPIPSVCVQLMEGNDDLTRSRRSLQIRLCLACWNPGEHGDATFQVRNNPAALGGYSYYLLSDKSKQRYARNMAGWKDSLTFADLVLRELENAEYIAGLRIVKEDGIKFGLFTEDGNVWDYYPYWHNWISFTLEAGITPKSPKIYENLL